MFCSDVSNGKLFIQNKYRIEWCYCYKVILEKPVLFLPSTVGIACNTEICIFIILDYINTFLFRVYIFFEYLVRYLPPFLLSTC